MVLVICSSTVSSQAVEGRVAFISTRGGHANLWVFNLKTNDLTCLTNFPDNTNIRALVFPCCSNDGKKIAFTAKKYGEKHVTDLWVINDDGTDLRRIIDYDSP